MTLCLLQRAQYTRTLPAKPLEILLRVGDEHLFISLLFIVFYPCNILIIYLYSNKLHSIDIFYKQHIKIFVLSKTLKKKSSPTCFGHYLTIIGEILYLS